MLTNNRSLKLLGNNIARLTAKSILNTQVGFFTKEKLVEPPEVYDDFAKVYTNYDERLRTILNSSENINGQSSFQIVI